jgi:hypothetical protein
MSTTLSSTRNASHLTGLNFKASQLALAALAVILGERKGFPLTKEMLLNGISHRSHVKILEETMGRGISFGGGWG